jgi:hypothetical protein
VSWTWDDVLKFILVIVGGFGGFSGIAILLIKYCANTLAERLSKKYELRLNKEFEDYKEVLGNRSYVSRARFDIEFKVYEEISHGFLIVIDEISEIAPTETGIHINDEVKNINHKLQNIKDLLYRSMPILPEKIYDFLYSTLLTLFEQTGSYQALVSDVDVDTTKLQEKHEILALKQKLTELLRWHFSSLDIAN